MQNKPYQITALEELRDYTRRAAESRNAAVAFREYWEAKGVTLSDLNTDVRPYRDTLGGVPRVTAKVPTAGGKTFIACNALSEIIDNYIPTMLPRIIVWFVPSEPILRQTYRNLSDPNHPYRQTVNAHFNGAVQVYEKEGLLLGQNFRPEILGSQLSILVLEIQSFASNTKDLRSLKDNENLITFFKDDSETASLVNAISQYRPVVIIDESHNFQGRLRLDTVKLLKPRFVYELTATPRESSNVITYVSSMDLKSADMVKLPVIVSNRKSTQDVLNSAINLRGKLEELAKLEDNYIRPIVLLQAEPRTNSDSETFDKLRNLLINAGVPKEQIAVKVSGKDEIKNMNLMSPACPIRFIITVNALKEGWDCPFAYILASVADRHSVIDVEQILGRILRLPYAHKTKNKSLGMSYVLTSSANFAATMDRILASMNNAGFSRRDVRVDDTTETLPEPVEDKIPFFSDMQDTESKSNELPVIGPEAQVAGSSGEGTAYDAIDTVDETSLKDVLSGNDSSVNKSTDDILDTAQRINEEYEKQVEEYQKDSSTSKSATMDRKTYSIRDANKKVAGDIRFPEFYVKAKVNSLFSDEEYLKLSFSYLIKDFKLSDYNTDMTFAPTVYEARKIDVSSEGEAIMSVVDNDTLNELNEFFRGLSDRGKKEHLEKVIYSRLKKYDSIPAREIMDYISKALEGRTVEEMITMQVNIENTVEQFDKKIESLSEAYARKRFSELGNANKILTRDTYSFPSEITVNSPLHGLGNALYIEEENNLNSFELKVIQAISLLPNLLFWHRNKVRQEGYGIFGFVHHGHYPDFVLVFKSGVVAFVETKGNHLANGRTAMKKELADRLIAYAGIQKYKYYLVFETEENHVPDSISFNQLMNSLMSL